MSLGELAYASLRHVRDLLRKKELSSEELTRAQIERIEAIEPQLTSFITVTSEEALAQARHADGLAARGELMGPLHGVPLTLKDLIWTRGVRTTSGSKIDEEFVPEEDATVVARLRSAGAVFLGKTNLHEFAYGVSSVNPHYGAVHNPWDLERIAGGSSGGSAAALAAGIGYGSVGTDTGGSIRIPSALCATVGLKPTYGRVSRYGVTPLAWSLDHVGPMTRRVEDAAILYEILAGRDEKDPTSAHRPVGEVSQRVGQLPSGLRMGIVREVLFEELDAEVEALVSKALDDLEGLGLERVEISLPPIRHQGVCRNVISFSEATAYHEADLRQRPEAYGEGTRALLHLGLAVRATEYLAAQRARRWILQAFRDAFRKTDCLVCPTVPAPAPGIGEERLSNGEELRAGLLRMTSPFNTVGFPAISVPCGFTRSGLPVGVQIVTPPFEEERALQVAFTYETSHDWVERHPPI